MTIILSLSNHFLYESKDRNLRFHRQNLKEQPLISLTILFVLYRHGFNELNKRKGCSLRLKTIT